MDKFIIPLSNGYRLIAERNTGEFDKELYVGIEDDTGFYVQDLAIIRPTYKFKDNDVVFDSDKFEMLIFADEKREDYTDKFIVPLIKDKQEDQ